MEVPSNYTIQYNAQEIQAQVKRLGQEISCWVKEVKNATGQDVIGVPVLRGGIFFFSDLVREIDSSVDIAPIRSWAYKTQDNSMNSEVEIELSDLEIADNTILLVDDICETGRTLTKLAQTMNELGAKEVRSAVLIKRDLGSKTFNPDHVAFHFTGQDWFVGYGMDDQNRYRNLPDIYTIKQIL